MKFINHWLLLVLLLLPIAFRLDAASFLGLRLVEIDADRAKVLKLTETTGVEVTAVLEGGAADQGGIRPGDAILIYNGEKVLGVQQFVRLVSETPSGRVVRVTYWREGARKNANLTIGSRDLNTGIESPYTTSIEISDVPVTLTLWRDLPLGIESQVLNDQLAQYFGVKSGILVWTVAPSYPAQRAGMRAGDVLVTFCGHTIRSPRELGLILQEVNTHQNLSVELVRDHKPLSIVLTLQDER